MKLHWQIVIALVLGAIVGGLFQTQLEADPYIGVKFVDAPGGGALVESIADGSPAAKAQLATGGTVAALVRHNGDPELEERVTIGGAADAAAVLASMDMGEALWIEFVDDARQPRPVTVTLAPDSQRAGWIKPFAFIAEIFLSLLKMLIVPVILTSIITGVANVGSGRDLRRLGTKTFAYYLTTSLLAAVLGLTLVNLIRPGDGAMLGLAPSNSFEEVAKQSFWDILLRMVPPNIFAAFSDNAQMLQVIVFALFFGFFITRAAPVHRERMSSFFESAFEVMMEMAKFILGLIPYGVFALLVKVLAETGFALFKPLGLYMVTVAAALLIHALVTLPIIVRVVGGLSPLRWAKAMGPALMTAFSTSSSSMTLPVTLESVEKRGGVSNRVTSFVLPLGATINMDGTALYECIGVIFLAQYYAGIDPALTLTLTDQVLVVMMALMASVGAAGIPSAGLVMMLTILSALGLPVEGAALLLAVDRPLDMMRTVVNVWSDSCGAAVVASTENERPLALTTSIIEPRDT